MTRWPTRPAPGLPYMAALEVALGCPQDADGRLLRPLGMTAAEATAFGERWRTGRRRLELSYPDSADVWEILDAVFP